MEKYLNKTGELDNLSHEAEQTARILLSIGAVSFSLQKPYRWVSGLLAPIYTDNRLLMGFPSERKQIVGFLTQKAKPIDCTVIAGIASAGIPFASWLSDALDKPMVFIRKETKDHGKEKRVEGILRTGQKVLLVEDLVSTGKSSLEGVAVLREEGAIVSDCLCIFSYDTRLSHEAFEKANVRLHPLTTIQDLLDAAEKMGKIAANEKQSVVDFLEDPPNWAKKRGLE